MRIPLFSSSFNVSMPVGFNIFLETNYCSLDSMKVSRNQDLEPYINSRNEPNRVDFKQI